MERILDISMNIEEIQEELQSILDKLEELGNRIDDVLGDYGRPNAEDERDDTE